jgi:hypothetical protein
LGQELLESLDEFCHAHGLREVAMEFGVVCPLLRPAVPNELDAGSA